MLVNRDCKTNVLNDFFSYEIIVFFLARNIIRNEEKFVIERIFFFAKR